MNLRAAIIASLVLHVALLGYAHTVEAPQEVEQETQAFRKLAAVEFKTVHIDEVEDDGADDPAKGAPNPAKKEPEPKPEPKEPEPKPAPQKPEPKPEPKKELKSVVADKREDSKSPAETEEAADATAKTVASTAPVDGGDSAGTARPDQTPEDGVGAATQQTGKRGIRRGTGVDARKLNQKYGLILHRRISGAKSYPRFARKAGIEGRLLVAITVDATGHIIEVKVRKSSGHEILDSNALKTIQRLERFPKPPSGLRWTKKTFVLPVSYKLG